MNGYEKYPSYNIFDDRQEDYYFNDLSNMAVIYEKIKIKVISGSIRCENLSFVEKPLYRFFLVNKYNGHVELICYFSKDNLDEIQGIVAFVQTRGNDGAYNFVYSIGYYLRDKYRKQGLGMQLVESGTDNLRCFFKEIGGNVYIEPYPETSYLIEAVVEKGNVASNTIAAKVINSFGKSTEGVEHFSGNKSNVYTLDLFCDQARQS